MTEGPIQDLRYFDKVFTIECGVFVVAIGGVLSQEGRPIAFYNEKLNNAKIRNESYDKKLYVSFQMLKKWRNYILHQ